MIKVIGWKVDDNEQRQIAELKKELCVKSDSQILRMAVGQLHKKIFQNEVDISTQRRVKINNMRTFNLSH